MAKDDDKGGQGGGNPGDGGDNPGQGGGNPGPGGGSGNEVHGKQVTIYVNTRAKKWDKEKISYDELVRLATSDAPPPTGGNIEYTITYRNGDKHKLEGNLAPGESVKVADGEIFDVYPTDKS